MKKVKYLLLTIICLFSCMIKCAAISNIRVNNQFLIPTFSKDIKKYNVFVSEKTDEINISVVLEKDDIEVSNDGVHKLKEGINEIDLFIKNKKANVVYKIIVIKGELKEDNKNSLLKTLSVEGIDFNFNPKIYEYELEVSEDLKDLKIDYEPMSYLSSVKVKHLNSDEVDNISITVISPNKKNKSVYQIKLKKYSQVFKNKDKKNNKKRKELDKNTKIGLLLFLFLISFIIIIIIFKFMFL